jgi:hypothetical protein
VLQVCRLLALPLIFTPQIQVTNSLMGAYKKHRPYRAAEQVLSAYSQKHVHLDGLIMVLVAISTTAGELPLARILWAVPLTQAGRGVTQEYVAIVNRTGNVDTALKN